MSVAVLIVVLVMIWTFGSVEEKQKEGLNFELPAVAQEQMNESKAHTYNEKQIEAARRKEERGKTKGLPGQALSFDNLDLAEETETVFKTKENDQQRQLDSLKALIASRNTSAKPLGTTKPRSTGRQKIRSVIEPRPTQKVTEVKDEKRPEEKRWRAGSGYTGEQRMAGRPIKPRTGQIS